MKQEEHNLQVACVNWFSLTYPTSKILLYATPNGGNRNIITAKKLKAEGVRAGVSDLTLSIPNKYRGVQYHGLFIEIKSPTIKTPKLSTSQEVFKDKVEEQGYLFLLCNSYDFFVKVVSEYMSNKDSKKQEQPK